ncbi:NAC domain-containing protein 26-like [Diospyros lotus]|uniref:NAC domain-containing protein 26-like n=1 Tax=Diospyros lotus TaxID=55363 RepID=UPI002256B280|nr:NAC domain-containing protein 26-like [Diospyros lotus]
MEENKTAMELPCGYKFSPGDKEIVKYFLKQKILNEPLEHDTIPSVDLECYDDPDHLPLRDFKNKAENEWFFYTSRPKRKPLTKNGCWREHKEEEVLDGQELVGFVQKFDYYYNLANPPEERKFEWYINEYRIEPSVMEAYQLDETTKQKVLNLVVCKVFREEIETTMDEEAGNCQSSDEEIGHE